eukprot:m51a1_g3686 hypothetical protein (578) ;mRNA; r:336323-338745
MKNMKKLALIFLVFSLGALASLVAIAASSRPSAAVARGARSAPLLSADTDADDHTSTDASASRSSDVFQGLGSPVIIGRHALAHSALCSAGASTDGDVVCDVATLEVVIGDVDTAETIHGGNRSTDSPRAQDDAVRAASGPASRSDADSADDDTHRGQEATTHSDTSAGADATTCRPVPSQSPVPASPSCATRPASDSAASDCAAGEVDTRSDCHENSDSAAAVDGAEAAADEQRGADHEDSEEPQSSSGEDAMMGWDDPVMGFSEGRVEHSPDSGVAMGIPDSQHTDLHGITAGTGVPGEALDATTMTENNDTKDGEVPDDVPDAVMAHEDMVALNAVMRPVVERKRPSNPEDDAAWIRRSQLVGAANRNDEYVARLCAISLFAREAACTRLLPRRPLQSLLLRHRKQPGNNHRDSAARRSMAAMADALDTLAEAHTAFGAQLQAAVGARAWADPRETPLWAALGSLRAGKATRAYADFTRQRAGWTVLMGELRASSRAFRRLCADFAARNGSLTPEVAALEPVDRLEQLSLLVPTANASVLGHAPIASAAAAREARELRAWLVRVSKCAADSADV